MAGDEQDARTNDDVEAADGLANTDAEGSADSAGRPGPGQDQPDGGTGSDADAKAGANVEPDDRSFDDIAAAMAEAIENEADSGIPSPDSGSLEVPELDVTALAGSRASGQSIDLLRDVELNVKIELGRSRMTVEEVLRLGEGAVVELDKLAGDPVDVFVNDRLIARGEVLVLNDNFCVRVNEIVGQETQEAPA